jgi:hypothetical protein
MVPKELVFTKTVAQLFPSFGFSTPLSASFIEQSENNYSSTRPEKVISEEEVRELIQQVSCAETVVINKPNASMKDEQFVRILKAICSLRGTRKPFHLYLSGNKITTNAIRDIVPILEADNSIATLDLSFNRIDGQAIKYLEEIFKKNYAIIELNLYGNPFHEYCADPIRKYIKRNRIVQNEFSLQLLPRFDFFVELIVLMKLLLVPDVLKKIMVEYVLPEMISPETMVFVSKYFLPRVMSASRQKLLDAVGNDDGKLNQEEGQKNSQLAARLTVAQESFKRIARVAPSLGNEGQGMLNFSSKPAKGFRQSKFIIDSSRKKTRCDPCVVM